MNDGEVHVSPRGARRSVPQRRVPNDRIRKYNNRPCHAAARLLCEEGISAPAAARRRADPRVPSHVERPPRLRNQEPRTAAHVLPLLREFRLDRAQSRQGRQGAQTEREADAAVHPRRNEQDSRRLRPLRRQPGADARVRAHDALLGPAHGRDRRTLDGSHRGQQAVSLHAKTGSPVYVPLPNNLRVTTESLLPECMGQHHDQRCCPGIVLGG